MNNCLVGEPASAGVMAKASEDHATDAQPSSAQTVTATCFQWNASCYWDELDLIALAFMSYCCWEFGDRKTGFWEPNIL